MKHLNASCYSAQTCRRARPVNLDPVDAHLFSVEYVREIGPSRIGSKVDGTIFDSRLICRKDTGYFQSEAAGLIVNTSGRLKTAHFMLRYGAACFTPRTQIKSGLWVVDEWSHGYFHWLTEALCKIELLQSLSNDDPVILPAEFKKFPYVEQSLILLGIPFIFISKWKIAHFEQLKTVDFDFPPGNFNCHLLRQLSGRFGKIRQSTPAPKRRVWISRSLAERRVIINEIALQPVLSNYGFEIINLERLSLMEQIELMQNSAVIAGLHGAGLTNMLFLPKRSKVIEIRREGDTHSNCYYAMASSLQLDYYYLLANQLSGDVHSGDCYLPPEQLDQFLSSFNWSIKD
jgi:hypothetical protein